MNKNCLVLLATYNGEQYIREQLDSILNQKKVDVKVLVSDDMSSDSTLSIVKSYNDERIEILPVGDKYGSASQNFFRLCMDANYASFDYVAFADQDDIWELDKIEYSIKTIEDKKVDAFSSNVMAFWEDGKEALINKSQPQKEYDHFFSSAGPGCTYVFKRKLAENFQRELKKKIDLIKKIDFHDWLIYTYARSNGFQWHVDEYITMRYRQHANNEFGANSGIKMYKKRWVQSRNGWYSNQIFLTADFCNAENKPLKRLKSNSYLNRIKMLDSLLSYRRSFLESVFLGLILITPGFK